MSEYSVIIPNYNHGQFIERAVRAFLNQTRPPGEIIVVDDCSTDRSVAVVDGLRRDCDSVLLIERAARGGPLAAMNEGLARARFDYVVMAAADDFVEPAFAERSLACLEAHAAAGLCFMDPCARAEDGTTQRIPFQFAAQPVFFAPAEFAELVRRASFTIPSNAVVYRRRALHEIGGFRADLQWHADWLANFAISFRHGACYVPDALAIFFQKSGSYGEMGRRMAAAQRRLQSATLDVIRTEFGGISGLFKRAGLLPEMRLRSLFWIAGDAKNGWILSPFLVRRLVERELWSAVRPLLSDRTRARMRRMLAQRPRSKL